MIQQKINVIEVNEPWGTAKLVDGAIVQMRAIYVEVFQCLNDDGTPMFTPDGITHLYGVNHQIVLSVTSPPVINTTANSKRN